MRRTFAVVLGLCGLLAGGCASTVEGSGSLADGAVKPSGGGRATPSASPSGGSAATRGRRQLKCGGTVISPAGAPYCFSSPAGFQDVSSSVSVGASTGRGDKYRSAVGLATRDLIIVTVYEVPVDTDTIAAETLEGELKTVLAQLSAQGFTFDSTTAERSTVDGARTFSYHARQDSQELESDVYFLFRGKNEIQVNCQWKEKATEIGKGCASVLQSLQVKTVK
jgi:hypothetical protein